MIKHIAILFTFIFVNSILLGQKEELTLEDAVLQQYRKFYPKKLSMFQWIGKTSSYTYLDNYTKLMKASVKDDKNKAKHPSGPGPWPGPQLGSVSL